MKEHPILFSAPMVKAILEGRKTMTRRVIKPQPKIIHDVYNDGTIETEQLFRNKTRLKCPYGQAGDRLWVRETYLTFVCQPICYKADGYLKLETEKWHPSIFMPRWASRITLEITNIRVERVWGIRRDKKNWIAEGYTKPFEGTITWALEADRWFAKLWDSINAKRGYSWESNPWVWVIEFKKIS